LETCVAVALAFLVFDLIIKVFLIWHKKNRTRNEKGNNTETMARNEGQGLQQEIKGNDSKAITSASSQEGKSSSNDSNVGEVNPASIKEKVATTTTTKSSYRDYSQVAAESSALRITHAASTKEQTFPVKLHMILSNPDFEDIVGWLPHGRSWRILQQKAFEEKVIPLYFRHGRYSSFARQVNGWGYRRITHGSDYNSYYHEVRTCSTFMVRCPWSVICYLSKSFHESMSSKAERSFLLSISERIFRNIKKFQCLTFFSLLYLFFPIAFSSWPATSLRSNASLDGQGCRET
jgi:hypothetical protein